MPTTAPPLPFTDDFSDDVGWLFSSGYEARTVATPNPNLPSKWVSAVSSGTVEQEIRAAEGRNSTPALRLKFTYPHTGLTETGRLSCEFAPTTKIFIRLWLKVSEGYIFGQPAQGGMLHKMYRLHQSPWTAENPPPSGVNNEDNSGFIVNTLRGGGGSAVWPGHTCNYRSGVNNSSNGPAVVYQNRNLGIPFGDYDAAGVFTNTKWVKIETYYELGDDDQDNGIIRQWFDGVEQPAFSPGSGILAFGTGSALPITGNGLVTNKLSHYGNPPGFNAFTLFDNHIYLTADWTSQHYLYIDSVELYDALPDDMVTVPSPGNNPIRPFERFVL